MAKIIIATTMVEKHKMSKDLQTFYKCNMCNYTIKLTFYCLVTRQAAKGIKNNALCDVSLASVDGQKLKAQKIILSASSIFFKKLLLND